MQFVLNQKTIQLDAQAPDMTLLRYLREAQRLTGTKEGCASGDCGACTVLVGSPSAQGTEFKAVNSCIVPLGSLQNQVVITIEGLGQLTPSRAESLDSKSPNSTAPSRHLHPVQSAMLECHGSQCGFCTPGFVMSLAALHQAQAGSGSAADSTARAQVLDAISGNLCRCTGYRPIVDAGIAALKKPAQAINIVQAWQPDAPITGKPLLAEVDSFATATPEAASATANSNGYWQPQSETQLQSLMRAYPGARLVAGGTDLMLEVTQQFKRLPQLIDLSAVPSLTAIAWGDLQDPDAEVAIGAARSYSQLELDFKTESPEFVRLLSRLGSRQIRNRGTLGGNIGNASPIADCPAFLLVLNAELVIGNAQGNYRRLPLAEFYLDYKRTSLAAGEYLAQVCIKRAALRQPLRLAKISKRYEDDISAVMGAFSCDLSGKFAIAYGGMAAIPKRASATEAFLNQFTELPDAARLEQAAQILAREFKPLSDVRASAAYRLAMAANLLKDACAALANPQAASANAGVFDHA